MRPRHGNLGTYMSNPLKKIAKLDCANCALVVYWITMEAWKSIFFCTQWMPQWQNLQGAIRSPVQFFSRLIAFWMHTSTRISIGYANSTWKNVFHLVMFHMQSAYLPKVDSSSESTQQFFSVPLRASAQASSTVLHIVTEKGSLSIAFVYIVGICSEKIFSPFIFDSDYPDTSLNRLCLTKQSSPDERNLTYTSSLTV